MKPVRPRDLSDYLLAHGRPVVTLADAADVLGVDLKHASSALTRLRRANRMFSPSRGLYMAVPAEYRLWGAVPALDFIDPMMRNADVAYYVGMLSAAELHGAAHQRPQVFQVMTDRHVAGRDFGRVRVRFYQHAKTPLIPVEVRNTRTGQVRVATPAVVALDLAARPDDGGGLSNVATVVSELAEDGRLTPDALASAAALYPSAAVRRLGWLLEFVDARVDTGPLEAATRAGDAVSTEDLLQPGAARRGHRNKRWRIIENTKVEPDL